jgi:hypothetical protein
MEQRSNTRQIPATEILAWMTECLDVRPETGELIWTRPPKQHPRLVGTHAGSPQASRGKSYVAVQHNGRKFKRSWLIFLWVNNRWPAKEILDHADGNSLNDAIDNLREATFLENNQNHKAHSRHIQLPMGVRRSAKRFVARLTVNGRQISLGAFDTINEAHAAYLLGRKEAFGDFA